MKMPAQKPATSFQDYGTPRDLIQAVQNRFGPIAFDLAASAENTVAKYYFSEAQNGLAQQWPCKGINWLNPQFKDCGLWAKKCNEQQNRGCRTIMLTPASIGAEWFANYVEGKAGILALRPRITFVGCKDPYPKDCMLTLWGGFGLQGTFHTWRWKP